MQVSCPVVIPVSPIDAGDAGIPSSINTPDSPDSIRHCERSAAIWYYAMSSGNEIALLRSQ